MGWSLKIGGIRNKAVMITVFEQSFDLLRLFSRQHEMDRYIKFLLFWQIQTVDDTPYVFRADQVFPALALNMHHAVVAFKASVGNKDDRPLEA